MNPAATPVPVPVARLRLQKVQVRGPGQRSGAPVFHVFEELFRRAVERPHVDGTGARSGPRA